MLSSKGRNSRASHSYMDRDLTYQEKKKKIITLDIVKSIAPTADLILG